MAQDTQSMNQESLEENPTNQLARLREEHQDLKKRIEELDRAIYLTPQERIERKTLQKLKLQKKDQIQLLLHQSGDEFDQ